MDNDLGNIGMIFFVLACGLLSVGAFISSSWRKKAAFALGTIAAFGIIFLVAKFGGPVSFICTGCASFAIALCALSFAEV
jgi:hypothetical protein